MTAAVTPTQFVTDLVNASFQAAYDAASWLAKSSVKSAWDTALLPENITKELAKLNQILVTDGLQLATLDTPPVPVPCV